MVTNAYLTGGMDTEIADTVWYYITLLQALFSTWVAIHLNSVDYLEYEYYDLCVCIVKDEYYSVIILF